MPAAPRKSTGNTRNKKHIPYRHDDLQHGKRTGMAVNIIDRNSDGFEPFDKILSQADTRTPPRVKGAKRKNVLPSLVYEDEDGEMSMDTASSILPFSSQCAHVPESIIPPGPSARTSYFSPEVDFDEVPHPRVSVAAIPTPRRQSSAKLNGKSPGSGLGQSRLSRSHLTATPKMATARASKGGEPPRIPGDSDEDLDEEFEPPPTFEYRSRNTALSLSPEQTSFRELSRDEGVAPDPDLATPVGDSRQKAGGRPAQKSKNDNKPLFLPDPGSGDEQPEESASRRTNRRKSSMANVTRVELEENPPEDMEMDLDPPVEGGFISRWSRKLSPIMEAPEPEEEQPEPEQMDFEQDGGTDGRPEGQPDEPLEEPDEPPPASPPKKRGRKKISFDENSTTSRRPTKKPRSNRTPLADRASGSRYVSIRPVSASPENPHGLRRGRRYRYPPLDWWRLEKVVYGADRAEDQDGDEDEGDKPVTLVPPIKAIIRVPQEPVEPLGKKHKKRRGKSVTVDPESVPFPEAGWDKDTESHGNVVDYITQEEVRRKVAFTTQMAHEVPAKKAKYAYQKIFNEGDNIAAGHIQLDPGAEKPNKSSKDNSYVFHVVEGVVRVKIHTTSFVICQGGCFLVPRGNFYSIENVCKRTVKIFFTQYRNPSGDKGAETQANERPNRRTEAAELSTPPIVQREKTRSQIQKAKGKEKITPKVGPPKGRKKK